MASERCQLYFLDHDYKYDKIQHLKELKKPGAQSDD